MPSAVEVLIGLLVIGCVLELAILAWPERKALLDGWDNDRRKLVSEETRAYGDRALNMAGLTMATIALIYGFSSAGGTNANDVLAVLTVALGFFLVSFSSENLTLAAKGVVPFQDKALAYGFMTMYIGIALLFQTFAPPVAPYALAGLVLVMGWHILEFWVDLKTVSPVKGKARARSASGPAEQEHAEAALKPREKP